VIAAAAVLLNTPRSMSAVWYGPYLSAAENLTWGGRFLVNLDEVKAFREMSEEERNDYRFTAATELEEYIANPLGYAYFIYAAKRIFPWLPDVPALEALHILLHTLLSVLVIALLQGWRRKLLFLFLYALNPVVIYYVTFPYYYFLQAIPSFGLIFLMLTRDRWATPERPWLMTAFLLLCVALAFVLLARSTTIAAIVAFLVLAALWYPTAGCWPSAPCCSSRWSPRATHRRRRTSGTRPTSAWARTPTSHAGPERRQRLRTVRAQDRRSTGRLAGRQLLRRARHGAVHGDRA